MTMTQHKSIVCPNSMAKKGLSRHQYEIRGAKTGNFYPSKTLHFGKMNIVLKKIRYVSLDNNFVRWEKTSSFIFQKKLVRIG